MCSVTLVAGIVVGGGGVVMGVSIPRKHRCDAATAGSNTIVILYNIDELYNALHGNVIDMWDDDDEMFLLEDCFVIVFLGTSTTDDVL